MITPIYNKLVPIVAEELERAKAKHGDVFIDNHHAYAVTLEEIDEAREATINAYTQLLCIWDNIKRDEDINEGAVIDLKETAIAAACECIQIAAMCDKWRQSDLLEGMDFDE